MSEQRRRLVHGRQRVRLSERMRRLAADTATQKWAGNGLIGIRGGSSGSRGRREASNVRLWLWRLLAVRRRRSWRRTRLQVLLLLRLLLPVL